MTEAPKKTDLEIQREAETARLRLGFAKGGFASTILTAGLGDTSAFQTSTGVALGGF